MDGNEGETTAHGGAARPAMYSSGDTSANEISGVPTESRWWDYRWAHLKYNAIELTPSTSMTSRDLLP